MSIVSGHSSSQNDATQYPESFLLDDDQLDLFTKSRESNSEAGAVAVGSRQPEAGSAATYGSVMPGAGGNTKAEPDHSAQDALQRLAESVRWLQNETAACRLPRATQLPPVEGLPAFDPDHYGDDPVDPFAWNEPPLRESPAALFVASEAVVRTAVRRQMPIRRIAALLLACGGASALWLINGHIGIDQNLPVRAVETSRPPGDLSLDLGLRPGLSAEASLSIAASGAPATTDIPSSPPIAGEASTRGIAVEAMSRYGALVRPPGGSSAPGSEAAPAVVGGGRVLAGSPDETTGQQGADERLAPALRKDPPKAAVLKAAEIASLLVRGKTYFEAGDVAAARLLFRRAAEAGDSSAAVAMGSTYDPAVLAAHFVHGIEADAEKARNWYEKARSPEGPRRIEMLARQ